MPVSALEALDRLAARLAETNRVPSMERLLEALLVATGNAVQTGATSPLQLSRGESPAYVFVSSNTAEGTTLKDAVEQLIADPYESHARQFRHLPGVLDHKRALGVWKDGAEGSHVLTVEPARARVIAALTGLHANQKGVLYWRGGEGADPMHTVHTDAPGSAVLAAAAKHGVPYVTITDGGAHVVDFDGALAPNVQGMADELGGKLESFPGNAVMLEGEDRESAAKVYKAVLGEGEKPLKLSRPPKYPLVAKEFLVGHPYTGTVRRAVPKKMDSAGLHVWSTNNEVPATTVNNAWMRSRIPAMWAHRAVPLTAQEHVRFGVPVPRSLGGPYVRNQAFEDAIDENPTDSNTHAIYADWLEENGDEKEAGFRRSIAAWIDKLRDRGRTFHLYGPDSPWRADGHYWFAVPSESGERHPPGIDLYRDIGTHGGFNALTSETHNPVLRSGSILTWPTYRDMEDALRHAYHRGVDKHSDPEDVEYAAGVSRRPRSA